jgi:hypothetical protein
MRQRGNVIRPSLTRLDVALFVLGSDPDGVLLGFS